MGRPPRIESPVEKARRIRDLILIRAARTALGMSQRDLAGVVNLHFSALARFECGNLRLRQDHIRKIVAYFEQAGISFQETDQGDLLMRLSGQQLDTLVGPQEPTAHKDQNPGFKL